MAAPPRTVARRVLAALLAVVAAVPFFGLVDLSTLVGLADPSEQWPVPVEASWGSFFTVLVAGAYGWIAIARNAWPGFLQLGITTVSLLFAAAGGLDPGPLLIAVGIGLSAALLLVLGGRRGRVQPDPPRRWSQLRDRWPETLLAAAALVLWLPYALAALARSRAGAGSDVTNGFEHWPVQGATGLALLLTAIALAVWAPGPRLLGVSAGITGGLIAIAALLYPDRIGATEGTIWAVAALAWALVIGIRAVARRSTIERM